MSSSAFFGKSAALLCSVGKGYVVLLGTFPDEMTLGRLARRAADLAGATVYDVSRGIMVTRRVKENGQTAHFVCAMSEEGGIYRFDGKKTDLIRGTVHEGQIDLGGFEVAYLK